jgi:hypothetical protein
VINKARAKISDAKLILARFQNGEWQPIMNLAIQPYTRCESDYFAEKKGADCQTRAEELIGYKTISAKRFRRAASRLAQSPRSFRFVGDETHTAGMRETRACKHVFVLVLATALPSESGTPLVMSVSDRTEIPARLSRRRPRSSSPRRCSTTVCCRSSRCLPKHRSAIRAGRRSAHPAARRRSSAAAAR